LYLTNELGHVNVAEYWSIEGYAVPKFIDVEGAYKLVVGSKTGYLHLYDSIETNISTSFHLVDSSLDNIQIGTYSAPTISDINNDNRYEMVVGNERGGVALFRSADIANIGLEKIDAHSNSVLIYPNPANDLFTIDFVNVSPNWSELSQIQVLDFSGRIIYSMYTNESTKTIETQNWDAGTYLVRILNNDQQIIRKNCSALRSRVQILILKNGKELVEFCIILFELHLF
jgi:hypothetical protein